MLTPSPTATPAETCTASLRSDVYIGVPSPDGQRDQSTFPPASDRDPAQAGEPSTAEEILTKASADHDQTPGSLLSAPNVASAADAIAEAAPNQRPV
jgi:hypothetical protein